MTLLNRACVVLMLLMAGIALGQSAKLSLKVNWRFALPAATEAAVSANAEMAVLGDRKGNVVAIGAGGWQGDLAHDDRGGRHQPGGDR